MMRDDDPRHGEYAGFQAHMKTDKNPCDPCRAAQRRYYKRMKFNIDNGHRERVVLGQDAWDVIHSMSRGALAARTGMSANYLSKLHAGGVYKKVYARSRDKILAATPAPTPVGIQRRIQALHALGYSWAVLERESDVHHEGLSRLAHNPAPVFVRGYVTDALIATYARLHMTLPTPSRSVSAVRHRAQRLGWPPPLAWDDIDDPAERPRGVAAISNIRERRADHEAAECPRCGVRRQVRTTQRRALCPDCKGAERRAS